MSETFGALGRFQLYSITMVDLDDKRRRDLRTITLFMPNHSETVYERDDEEEIPVGEGKPLSLIGPSRPCYPYDQLRIVFGDLKTSKWEYRTNYDKELEEDRTHQTITEYVKDKDSNSGALICFALLEEAIDAKLDFTYEDKDKGRVIRITEGEIYATTAGDDLTKLVLRSFGPTETSTHKKKSRYHPKGGEEEEFYPGEPMLLDRSILGLPLGEDLHVTVNVKYYLVPLKIPDAGIVHGHIFETHTVLGPDSPNISNWDFSNAVAPGAKLKLKVTWFDNLRAEREALRLHMLAIAESFSGKLSEGIAVTGKKRRRLESDSNKYQQAEAWGMPALVASGISSVTGATEKFKVPNEKVGMIIGKGGDTIKNMQTVSGAQIQVIPQHLPKGDQSTERTVVLTGDERQIALAKQMI